jgi:hypothetical protein
MIPRTEMKFTKGLLKQRKDAVEPIWQLFVVPQL